jgi:arylsulfatase A-like enzyme
MNVIVIMADSWRFDYLGCYGNDWIKTPNIDKFAQESILFENAYAEGCPTVPTRKTLFTGRYTLPASGWSPLQPKDIVIADILWWEHVRTALISDTAVMHFPGYGLERGFNFVQALRGQQWDPFYRNLQTTLDIEKYHKPFWDPNSKKRKRETEFSLTTGRETLDYLCFHQTWKGEEDQMVARVMNAAIDYLETKYNKNNPLFLWIDSFDPHEPWDPPSVWDPDLDYFYDPGYEGLDIINPVPTYVDGYLTEDETRHVRMLYAEKITMVDRWIGKFIQKLKELELYENSLIIFLSDHGEPLGKREHGHGIIRKCRPWPYEELSHIPLIVHHPDGLKGRIFSFVETVDIAPTILDFFGVKRRRKQIQGKSMIPLIKGEIEKLKDFVISGYFNFSWSIIQEDFSFIHWLDQKNVAEHLLTGMYGWAELVEDKSVWTCTPGSVPETPLTDELYNRQKDPFQLQNIIEDHPDIAKELHQRLRDFLLELKRN